MSNFYIYFLDCDGCWTAVGKVSGLEATYRAYKKACELAAILNKACAVVDGNTGEIIEMWSEEDE